jgi:hypothetical protein
MKIILLFLLLIPVLVISQISYSTEDLFSLNNPSSFSNKKMYATGLANLASFDNISALNAFLLYKQKIKSVSIGLNSEITRFGSIYNSKSELQIGYPYRINRKYTVNSGLGLTARTDNYFSISTWNPPYFGLNAGMNLVSKKWQIGLSLTNVTNESRIIDTLKIKIPSYASLFVSYDFKLDSLGKYHLIPSFYLEVSSNGFYSSLVNLKFNFSSAKGSSSVIHSIGFSYSRSQPSVFYQHLFKNGLCLGISVGKYLSPLYFSLDNFWNGMLRVNYVMKQKMFRFSGTPSF